VELGVIALVIANVDGLAYSPEGLLTQILPPATLNGHDGAVEVLIATTGATQGDFLIPGDGGSKSNYRKDRSGQRRNTQQSFHIYASCSVVGEERNGASELSVTTRGSPDSSFFGMDKRL